MPTPSSQSRASGFVPRFLSGGNDQHLRLSDAERRDVADRLAAHFGDGRLDQADFDERLEQAMNAKTRADLNGLFYDLPEAGLPGSGPGGGRRAAGFAPDTEGRRNRRRHPIALLALWFIAMVAILQAMPHVFRPFEWTGFLGPLVWIGLIITIVVMFGKSRRA